MAGVLLFSDSPKMRTFFFYGESNAGKSRMGDFLEKIFFCNTFSSSGDAGWSVVTGPRNINPQILLINEASLNFFFGRRMDETKRLMEGKFFEISSSGGHAISACRTS